MKKAVWIAFATIMLLWTGCAVLAAGLAHWASDAIASERMLQTAESVTQKLTDATDHVSQQVDTTLATSSSALPPLAPLPPLPEWVNLLLDPEMVQSIKDWGVWAMQVANAGKTAMEDTTYKPSEPAIAEQSPNLRNSATRSETDSSDKPWLANLIAWLVPIVWIIWGIGFILLLAVTLIALKLIRRFFSHPDDEAMAAA